MTTCSVFTVFSLTNHSIYCIFRPIFLTPFSVYTVFSFTNPSIYFILRPISLTHFLSIYCFFLTNPTIYLILAQYFWQLSQYLLVFLVILWQQISIFINNATMIISPKNFIWRSSNLFLGWNCSCIIIIKEISIPRRSIYRVLSTNIPNLKKHITKDALRSS